MLVTTSGKSFNPWLYWVKKNPQATNEFLESLKTVVFSAMKDGYAVDDVKLTALKVKLKRVPNVLK